MKFIHAADIHLGAKMDSKYPKQISDRRKEEVRNTFKRMVEFAKENFVTAILLCGDVFDSDLPFKKDKDFFLSVVKNTPNIDFLYLKGNHDTAPSLEEALPNLKTFTNSWSSYRYGNVNISGIECSSENAFSLYSSLSLEKEDCNIVMMHGQTSEIAGKDKIALKRLREKYIDYLALGHIHKPKIAPLDDRGTYAYAGCLEGRGFDEMGEHGFILLEAEDKLSCRFVPFSERKILEEEVDISGVKDAYSAYLKVKEKVSFDKKNIYRIDLVGETDYEIDVLEKDVEKYLSAESFFLDVKDKTQKKIDWNAFEKDLSLRGEFVRCVSKNSSYSEEEKKQIASLGLKALKGGAL